MLVVVSLLLLLAVSILNLAGPYLTKVVIDDYISIQQYEGLDRIALIYITVLVGAFVCQFLQYTAMQYIGQKVMFDLRTQVFAHLHKMSFRFFDRNPIGKMMTRTVNDVEVLNEMLTSGLILVFSDLFTFGWNFSGSGGAGLAVDARGVYGLSIFISGDAGIPGAGERCSS